MAEASKAIRVANLRSVAEGRKRDAYERAERAIRRLLLNETRLSFANVAREAQLSVAYLYKYPDLQRRIRHVSAQQDERRVTKIKPLPASDRSQHVVPSLERRRLK